MLTGGDRNLNGFALIMPNVTTLMLIIGALLFCAKMLYVLCTALALPYTQGALYVSTPRKRIRAAMAEIPLKAGDLLVDLGCGDGRLLRLAHQRCPIRAIGYELNWLAYIKARLLSAGRSKLTIVRRNFWKADLRKADVVCCYLFPDILARLAAKLSQELKPGATIVSFNFPLPGLTPQKKLRPGNSLHNDPIYIYQVPNN